MLEMLGTWKYHKTGPEKQCISLNKRHRKAVLSGGTWPFSQYYFQLPWGWSTWLFACTPVSLVEWKSNYCQLVLQRRGPQLFPWSNQGRHLFRSSLLLQCIQGGRGIRFRLAAVGVEERWSCSQYIYIYTCLWRNWMHFSWNIYQNVAKHAFLQVMFLPAWTAYPPCREDFLTVP